MLDQHRAGPRTVLSLAGGALSTHLDPGYRVRVRIMPHLSREAKVSIAVAAALIIGLPALVIVPMIPRAIRESRWQPSGSDSVEAIAFSRDQRIMVSATGGPPTWQVAGSGAVSDLTTIFRDVSDAQPTLAPGDRIVADGSLTGGQVHLWTLP